MDSVERMIHKLEAGSVTLDCSGYLAGVDPFVRTHIYTTLLYERLKRKNDYIIDLYRNEGQYWDEVFFIMMFRYLGAPANSAAFEKLARMVSYSRVTRYKHQPSSLEAMLLGMSGLLDLYPNDKYTHDLRLEFQYLSEKYSFKQKMSAGEWNMSKNYPYNNPVLRISQAISIISGPDFGIEAALKCRTSEDAERLFSYEASEYWSTHFVPGVESPEVVKRIGKGKSDILAINVIAPLQFSYGSYINSDRLRDRALNLLDSIAAESNSKVGRWKRCGLIPRSAFETQVLIQLGDEYCNKQRCRECPVGRQITKTLKDACKLKENK